MRIYKLDPGPLSARIVDFEGPAKPVHGSLLTFRKRQEKHFYTGYAVIDTGTVHNDRHPYIDLRIGGTDKAEYASIWLSVPEHICGFGDASGYGYHRPSEAVDNAIRNAQIALDGGSIGGRGDGAILEALSAIAIAIGMNQSTTIIIHTYA